MDIPKVEPSALTSGSTVKWSKSLGDYPASEGWTLKYNLRPGFPGGQNKTLTSTASGDEHQIVISAADSASIPAGQYFWFSYVVNSDESERYDVARGEITVNPNPTTSGKFDGRTHAQRMLDLIQAMMEGTASREEAEYEIDTPGLGRRRLKLFSRPELIQLYNFYKRERQNEIAAERVAKGLGSGRRILTRFSTPR